MIASSTDGDNPVPLKVHRQRGKRIESGNPVNRLNSAMTWLNDRRGRLVRESQRHIVAAVLQGRTVTADDLRHIECGDLRRAFVGAVFRGLHAAGVLRPNGWQTSIVPANHARPVVAWSLADADVAGRWLVDHPAPQPPGPKVQQSLPIGGDL